VQKGERLAVHAADPDHERADPLALTVEDSFTIDGKRLADASGVPLSSSTRRNKRRAACISARKLTNSRCSCASRN
jgi:hypothetical protein